MTDNLLSPLSRLLSPTQLAQVAWVTFLGDSVTDNRQKKKNSPLPGLRRGDDDAFPYFFILNKSIQVLSRCHPLCKCLPLQWFNPVTVRVTVKIPLSHCHPLSLLPNDFDVFNAFWVFGHVWVYKKRHPPFEGCLWGGLGLALPTAGCDSGPLDSQSYPYSVYGATIHLSSRFLSAGLNLRFARVGCRASAFAGPKCGPSRVSRSPQSRI